MSNPIKQIYFAIALHNHQPVGNFPWVFERAYQQAYLPMLEAIEKHPSLSFSVHYSGSLMDWFKQNHLDFIQRLAELVKRGQIEVISGGYYEPILPAIPDADKLGQIAKMNSFISRQFGFKPTGLWLAERVWEPYLTKILAQAGIQWTLVDDNHFKLVGIETKDLFGYYISEEQGYFVNIFPISKYLRYSIPWRTVTEVINYLQEEASGQETKIAVLGDDGEKFGIWPGTYDHCWRKKWVEDFFTALEDNQEWLHIVKLGDYIRKFPSSGRIYLPCAAYDEMLEWALPAEKSWQYARLKQQLEKEERQDMIQFLHGGFWRHFLVKYPEANRMHKKMLRVHKKVHESYSIKKKECGLDELWQAQCNEPYWHGIFGGVYLADLRAAAYRHLIQAETKADKILHKSKHFLNWQKNDFDGDGFEELIVEADTQSLYLSPEEGGSIFEWDLCRHNYNLLATLARRPEAYHRKLTEVLTTEQNNTKGKVPLSIHDTLRIKDRNLSHLVVYDQYPRSSLLDHFFSPDTKLDDFVNKSCIELGDFLNKPYRAYLRKDENKLRIYLKRVGVLRKSEEELPFEVNKQILLEAGKERLAVTYTFGNQSDSTVSSVFGSEWNVNLLGGGHNQLAYYRIPELALENYLDSKGELNAITKLIFGNRGLGVEIEVDITPEVTLWCFPVETISNSEAGIEKLYQENCFVFLLPFSLAPGDNTSLKLNFAVKP